MKFKFLIVLSFLIFSQSSSAFVDKLLEWLRNDPANSKVEKELEKPPKSDSRSLEAEGFFERVRFLAKGSFPMQVNEETELYRWRPNNPNHVNDSERYFIKVDGIYLPIDPKHIPRRGNSF